MPAILPETTDFRTAVYGTVFANRAAVVRRLSVGDSLILVPDPPGVDDPNVWVHAKGGDVVGHLPPSIGGWLASWMIEGGRAHAEVSKVGSDDVESWRRLIITVDCLTST